MELEWKISEMNEEIVRMHHETCRELDDVGPGAWFLPDGSTDKSVVNHRFVGNRHEFMIAMMHSYDRILGFLLNGTVAPDLAVLVLRQVHALSERHLGINIHERHQQSRLALKDAWRWHEMGGVKAMARREAERLLAKHGALDEALAELDDGSRRKPDGTPDFEGIVAYVVLKDSFGDKDKRDMPDMSTGLSHMMASIDPSDLWQIDADGITWHIGSCTFWAHVRMELIDLAHSRPSAIARTETA